MAWCYAHRWTCYGGQRCSTQYLFTGKVSFIIRTLRTTKLYLMNVVLSLKCVDGSTIRDHNCSRTHDCLPKISFWSFWVAKHIYDQRKFEGKFTLVLFVYLCEGYKAYSYVFQECRQVKDLPCQIQIWEVTEIHNKQCIIT